MEIPLNSVIRLATVDDARVISELILPLATTFIAHELDPLWLPSPSANDANPWAKIW